MALRHLHVENIGKALRHSLMRSSGLGTRNEARSNIYEAVVIVEVGSYDVRVPGIAVLDAAGEEHGDECIVLSCRYSPSAVDGSLHRLKRERRTAAPGQALWRHPEVYQRCSRCRGRGLRVQLSRRVCCLKPKATWKMPPLLLTSSPATFERPLSRSRERKKATDELSPLPLWPSANEAARLLKHDVDAVVVELAIPVRPRVQHQLEGRRAMTEVYTHTMPHRRDAW
ncbi:hypothetical protein FPV67DRAFT_1448961 [Lyophyllum atratum]|nr:hypothetical protein FPV67DRAFT_1448961 [Lyophyllum atratum]